VPSRATTEIYGGAGDDAFFFDETLLGGHTLVYGSASAVAGAPDGDDYFWVNRLQTMTGTHTAAPGDDFAGAEVRDALVLFGQGGDNTFFVQTWGSETPTVTTTASSCAAAVCGRASTS
jgi:hypothetical protein